MARPLKENNLTEEGKKTRIWPRDGKEIVQLARQATKGTAIRQWILCWLQWCTHVRVPAPAPLPSMQADTTYHFIFEGDIYLARLAPSFQRYYHTRCDAQHQYIVVGTCAEPCKDKQSRNATTPVQ